MGSLIVALVPLLEALLAGASVATAFEALTIPQWAAIGAALVNLATPEINAELAKLHPLIGSFVKDLETLAPVEAAAQAVQNVENFFKGPVQEAEEAAENAAASVGNFIKDVL